MADVLLRDMVDQLRGLIHAGKHADAFTLGEHILQSFPKHVETYTLLAQACLEVNDMAGATDLFRRVLSADPENVIALAGMALLNESQEKTDETLWYLERAYEVQPGNDDLRRELLRVRELFYGAPPARLELTAGALARVYARQGQFAHAVNEYRRLLRHDSKRYDARVGLAETLFRAGRTDEAAQVAQSIMADAPYSLKPNLILGYLWSENEVPEGQQFLKRAQQLDPEHRVARQLLGDRFRDGQPPRLPPLGERVFSSQMDDREIGVVSPGSAEDVTPSHAVEFLRELERAQEEEFAPDDALFYDLDALSLVEPIPASAPGVEAAQASLPVEMETAPAPEAPPTSAVPPPEPTAPSAVEPSAASEPDIVARLFAATGTPTATPAPDTPVPSTAEEQSPPASTPGKRQSDFASRLSRRGGEGLSPEALTAAANALAASIALDRSNQPAPTRRAHPAIPKVRPVIRGVAEKIPAWLRLGSTPAAASATFDLTPPNSTDTITPLKTPVPDQPDWLVQAQAAAAHEAPAPEPKNELPEWLKAGDIPAAPAAPIEPAKAASQAPQGDIPAWLQEVQNKASGSAVRKPVPPREETAHALPDWIKPEDLAHTADASPDTKAPPGVGNDRTEQTSEAVFPFTGAAVESTARDETSLASDIADDPGTTGARGAPELSTGPAALGQDILRKPSEPPARMPAAPVGDTEERVRAQAMPDSATMLQMARDKRASGDWKGAMELYERVMHRRPNFLEQVIGDLQEVVHADEVPTGANRLLGEAYAMAGRFKESLEQYRIAMGK